MYRSHIVYRIAYCVLQGVSPTGNNSDSVNKPKRVVRRVMPVDEEMADLQRVDAEATTLSEEVNLADVSVELMRFASMDEVKGKDHTDPFRNLADDDGEDDDNNITNEAHNSENIKSNFIADEGELHEQSRIVGSTPLTDYLLQVEGDEAGDSTTPHSIIERQAMARLLSSEELVEMVVSYLRATENSRLVSSDEEHVLFPVLMDRLNEFHVEQMLDIVECHWARSTLVRYGTRFKDMVRDRIALIASVAAKGVTQHAKRPTSVKEDEDVDDDDDNVDDTGDVYTHEVEKPKLDSILLKARDEMNAEGVLRCIVVMGMSAGRRKRDLQFFQAMGMFLVHHINQYKDPHQLVRVLTAFARAKIIPSKAFLALLGRRFAVLNKKKPLGSLPSYRAFVNMYKMGHDQMNSFKFFANCIFDTFDLNIKSEKKRQRLKELQRSNRGEGVVNEEKIEREPTHVDATVMVGDLDSQLLHIVKARERFKRLTELKPSMFTKLLLVLARFGAPHQQYLRPTIVPLILPTLRCFPPPSFSRLLRALRLFKTTDLELIEPIIDHLAVHIGPTSVLPEDVLEMIRIISHLEVPVPRNLAKLIALCEAVYTGTSGSTPPLIRPNDMCSVAAVLLKIQMKEDVPLDALDPLTRLMELFADRMSALMKLHVVSLTHVDIFTDLCQQQQHPDISGRIAKLFQERRHLSASEGDDEYYSQLDIDVRETFHKIMVVNDYRTYGQYRPTPGVLQVDFKQALTEVSAFDVLEATHLFSQAFPNALQPTVARHLSRSIIAKLGISGEEVITEDHQVVLRPPRELLLTKVDLVKFVELLQRTPLTRVKASPIVWGFVKEKAQKLGMDEILVSSNQYAAVASV